MKLTILSVLFSLILPVLAFPAQAGPVVPVWQPLAPGIEFREFFLESPNRVYVARLDRNHPDVFIESSIGMGRLSGESETVRGQAARYDGAINFWGRQWGSRNQVVVAINGSFFNPDTGVPWSGQIHSGWYAQRFVDRQESSGFVWTLDRQAFVGECVVNRPGKQQVLLPAAGKSLALDGINTPRGDDELIIYTPQYDARTPSLGKAKSLVEVLVDLHQPLTILPAPAQVAGIVRLIHEGEGGLPIQFDQLVLSATGKVATELLAALQPGERVAVTQEVRHLMGDCATPNPASWTNAYASVAGSFIYLKDGVVQPQTDLGAILRNPRTAVAINDRYVFFIVVDGRDRMTSQGMSMVELAAFAHTRLGAVDGIALDGGGSSTMVVNGELRNYPRAEPDDAAPPADGSSVGLGSRVERVVANGLMMVVARPPELSTRFKPGERVIIQDSSEVNLRLGPGTNFGILTALPPGAAGVVVEHALNGVLAKDYYWWKIDFAGTAAWVNQESLAPQP